MNNIISLLGTVPPATSTGPASLDDLMWLFAALGLSTTAGLRAYLPLLAIGVSYYINPNLLPLQSNFQLLHDPLVLGVLVVLTVVEFVLDKVPGIDHLSDIIHTIIRPASGAIIMAGTHNTLSDVSPWLAAAAGALLALSLHGVKATTRPVVTGTTVGHGNPVVSVIEDVLALGGTVLLLVLPLIGFIVVTIVLLLLLRLTRPLRRRLFGLGRRGRSRGAGGVAPTAPVVAASPPPPERQLGGLIGRAARRRAGSPAAAVPSPSPAASAYGPIPLPIPGPAPAAGAVVGRAASALGGAAAGVAAGAAAGLGAAAAAAGLGAAGAAAGPGAGSAATAPTAPLPYPGAAPLPAGAAGGMGIGTGTGDTTVQATNQAPYPPVAPNPVQPLGGQQAQMPTTTQPYPQPFPTPSQPPWNYPGNAPTLPGQQQP